MMVDLNVHNYYLHADTVNGLQGIEHNICINVFMYKAVNISV